MKPTNRRANGYKLKYGKKKNWFKKILNRWGLRPGSKGYEFWWEWRHSASGNGWFCKTPEVEANYHQELNRSAMRPDSSFVSGFCEITLSHSALFIVTLQIMWCYFGKYLSPSRYQSVILTNSEFLEIFLHDPNHSWIGSLEISSLSLLTVLDLNIVIDVLLKAYL